MKVKMEEQNNTTTEQTQSSPHEGLIEVLTNPEICLMFGHYLKVTFC